jgi:hypothetical protein
MREPDDATAPPPAPDLVPIERVRRRGRSRLGARARTLACKGRRRGLDPADAELLEALADERPRTRADCSGGARPCPWVACRHHLYVDVDPRTGSLKLNFPDRDPADLAETCALDVADRGGATLEEVGALLNVTRECTRQIEVRGLLDLRMASPSPDEIGSRALADRAAADALADFRRRTANGVTGGAAEVRRAAARRLLLGDPTTTDRNVRRQTGVSLETAARLRKELGIPPARGGRRPTQEEKP